MRLELTEVRQINGRLSTRRHGYETLETPQKEPQ